MEYEHISPSEIEVVITRRVTLGKQVQMVPSYGYSGVDSGPAKIIGILQYPMDGGWTVLEGHEGYLDDIKGSMEAFLEVELDTVSDDPNSHEYQEHYDSLYNDSWIAYRYLRGIAGEEPEVHAFPLNLFIAHSVPAI